jgi:integrase
MARLPSYRLHKASGQACTKIRGRIYYLGPFGSAESKTKFDLLLGEYFLSNRSATFGIDPNELTMAEVANVYLDHAREYYKGSTEAKNLVLALRPVAEVFPRKLVSEFGSAQFKLIQQWWIRRGASRQYVNKQCKRLVRAIKWLCAEGLMPVSSFEQIKCVEPLRRGRTPAQETKPIVPVLDTHVEKTLPHLSSVVAAMVRFQRLTGCRPGEVVRVKPEMVDRTHVVWEIHLQEHKTAYRGKQRTIFVGPAAQEVLKPYLDRKPDAFCFQPIEAMRENRAQRHAARTTPLSCGNRPGTNCTSKPKKRPGDCYTTESYGGAIAYACKKAFPAPETLQGDALRKWHRDHRWAPNQLRHTRATEIRKEFGLEAASIILGHSGLAVTEVYAERDRALAVDVVARNG